MVRVVLLIAVRFYRDGLARGLTAVPDFTVTGTADDVAHAVLVAQETQPDLVLADVQIPDVLDGIRVIGTVVPRTSVIVIGVRETEPNIIRCAEAGALGYVPEGATLDELVASARAAVQGEVRCSPRIAASLFRRLASQAKNGGPAHAAPLTLREMEISRHLEQGRSNKEIAELLGIELGTVKNHVHNLLAKLQARRRGEAVARLRHERPTDALAG